MFNIILDLANEVFFFITVFFDGLDNNTFDIILGSF